jgi:hypothetical protein
VLWQDTVPICTVGINGLSSGMTNTTTRPNTASAVRTLAIIGSRNFTDYDFMKRKIQLLLEMLPQVKCIVSGGAKGADALSERIAEDFHLDHRHIAAEWAKYGRAAGPLRNQKIIGEADVIAAFPLGESKGTQDGIRRARAAGKQVHIYLS